MRKIISIILSAVLILSLTACGSNEKTQVQAPDTPGTGVIPLASAAELSPVFTDVPASADYAQAVAWCYESGLMNGTSATLFSPDGTLTRSMLATVLYRAEKEPAVTDAPGFTDTQSGTWYSNAVVWANARGIMQGYGNGLFGTNDPVSVEQLEVIMGRYTGNGPEWTGDSARAYAATRAQVAVVLYTNLASKTDEPAPSETPVSDKPIVYMTTDISSDGLMAIYEALEASPEGKVAVKLSTGEPGSNYLRTDLIGELVQSLNATIVECNTAYGGPRSNTAMHKQVAEDHGYTAIATVDIMDEEDELSLPVTGGDNLKENYVGSHFTNYDYFVVLSHFKGHAMAGYGGAIKNISIGIASSHGKSHIHSGGTGGNMWSGDQDAFLESMAEAGKSVVDALNGNILYINVMNRLSVDCDCDGSPAEPDMHDIGILASYDPVALDQACVDLVYAAQDGGSLIKRIESRNGIHTLEQAEKIGLGSRKYELVHIDEQENNIKDIKDRAMKISVQSGGIAIIYELNDSPAAKAFYGQLPITTDVGNFSTNEKTFNPSQELDTNGATAIYNADLGTLAYYAPWGNIAMFYDSLSNGGSGLYELGKAISGADEIQNLSGTITITTTD